MTPEQFRRIALALEGAWGRAGATRVILETVAEEALGEALMLAWRNTKKLPRKKCR